MFWDFWKNTLNSAYEEEVRIEKANEENKLEQKFI